jgi:hypothetical protein
MRGIDTYLQIEASLKNFTENILSDPIILDN